MCSSFLYFFQINTVWNYLTKTPKQVQQWRTWTAESSYTDNGSLSGSHLQPIFALVPIYIIMLSSNSFIFLVFLRSHCSEEVAGGLRDGKARKAAQTCEVSKSSWVQRGAGSCLPRGCSLQTCQSLWLYSHLDINVVCFPCVLHLPGFWQYCFSWVLGQKQCFQAGLWSAKNSESGWISRMFQTYQYKSGLR